MGSKIRILPDLLINKIAAGEVVENPASVVKELVENSLDAKATKIVIETTGGGLGLIRISDDGSGMSRDDALLSVERHATSKLASEDLEAISTMGFRGEALASIGAISHLRLDTSDGTEGTLVEVRGGKLIKSEPSGRCKGTTIEVSSLFFNVPARKKFQKSVFTLALEIKRAATALSLASPTVAFELWQDGKRTLQLFSEPDNQDAFFLRAKRALGDDPWSQGSRVRWQEEQMVVEGLIGSPLHSHSNRAQQHLFINGRAVRSYALSEAVKVGFGTRLEQNRHPAFVLHVTLPYHMVDVNVHPQKKEVRLQDEERLFHKMKRAVSSSFDALEPKPFFSLDISHFTAKIDPTHYKEEFLFQEFKSASQQELPFQVGSLMPIGTFRHFVLFDVKNWPSKIPALPNDSDGLIIVDLFAAQSRILFNASEQTKSPPPRQALLVPLPLSFSSHEMGLFELNKEILGQLGFEVETIGPSSVMVNAMPSYIQENEAKEIILETIDELGKMGQDEKRRYAAACSSFVKRRKEPFTQQEALSIVENLLSGVSFEYCPLGNRIITYVSLYELAKFFAN